jgi:parallel beta-helix repeat protein
VNWWSSLGWQQNRNSRKSCNNIISNNSVCENRGAGIHLEDSPENEISKNIIYKNMDGITLLSLGL